MSEQSRISILIADDDAEIFVPEIRSTLALSGYDVEVAYDGEQAVAKLRNDRFDILLLDIEMPKLNGRDVLRWLRAERLKTGVICLSRLVEVIHKVGAFRDGADDYLGKPFDTQELIARIEAVVRRVATDGPALDAASQLVCDDLILDRERERVWVGGREIDLSRKAKQLLKYLMLNPDVVLSLNRILDNVWDVTVDINGSDAVGTRIGELRKKLPDPKERPRYIDTVYGGGYRFIGKVRGKP